MTGSRRARRVDRLALSILPTKELIAEALHAQYSDDLWPCSRASRRVSPASRRRARDVLFAISRASLPHTRFVVLADRRDIDKKRKKKTRARLRGQIAALLAGDPPIAPRAPTRSP